jgi:peroxiredoxin Q/BCP
MSSKEIDVGKEAPNFKLKDQDGVERQLVDYRGKSTTVLFFYPKDYTPVCTLEAIAFRDSYSDFSSAGAEVIGISSDEQQSHASFCASNKLPFRLLTDEENKVRDLYGATSFFGDVGSRVTFVIDRQGVIRSIYRSALRAKKHVQSSLEVAKALKDSELDFLSSNS